MKSNDRIYKQLTIIGLVLFIIIALLVLIGASCKAGKREGYDHPLNVDHIGAYHQIGNVGDGPRFQLYHGAGTYAFQPGASGYIGLYGDARTVGKDGKVGRTAYDPLMTPADWMYSGYLNAPRNPCTDAATCAFCSNKCNKVKRGFPERYDQYNYFPQRVALPP